MEPFEGQDLSDHELDRMLREWRTPRPPARLRAEVFGEKPAPWWKRSVRIPLPVAACLVLVIGIAGWRLASTRPAPAVAESRVVVRTERVEVPMVTTKTVTKVVYRDRPAPLEPKPTPILELHALTFEELQPVAALRPRIIRSEHVQN